MPEAESEYRYCTKCGNSLGGEVVRQHYCPFCGAPDEGKKFCPECGGNLSLIGPAPSHTAAPAAAPAAMSMAPRPAAPMPTHAPSPGGAPAGYGGQPYGGAPAPQPAPRPAMPQAQPAAQPHAPGSAPGGGAPAGGAGGAACPACGSGLFYVAQYNQWYCNSCKAYRVPAAGGAGAQRGGLFGGRR